MRNLHNNPLMKNKYLPITMLTLVTISLILTNAFVMGILSFINIPENLRSIFHIVLPAVLLLPILFLLFLRPMNSYIDNLRILSLAVEQSPNPIIITNKHGEIEYANRKFIELSGYQLEEVIGKSPSFLKSGDTSTEVYKDLWKTITSGNEWRGTLKNKKKNGKLFWERTHISPIIRNDGKIVRYIAIKEDITEQMKKQKIIKHLAYHDNLTDLPNRVLFNKNLKEALNDLKISNEVVAVMYLDLDGFKQINDSLGHAAGDKLLKNIAKRLLKSVRKTDTVARMGGDEFTILLPNINDVEDAKKIASKVLNKFQNPWVYEDQEYQITTSIGIAIAPNDGETVDSLINKADAAMYLAKEAGKNNYKL